MTNNRFENAPDAPAASTENRFREAPDAPLNRFGDAPEAQTPEQPAVSEGETGFAQAQPSPEASRAPPAPRVSFPRAARPETNLRRPFEAEAPVDAQRVSAATRKVEELFQTVRRNLEFREDPSSGRLVVSVIDAESGEIIRQIPPEQMIRMAEHLEQMNGLLLGERA